MPQMMPMCWIPVLSLMVKLFLIINALIYFQWSPPTNMNKTKNFNNKMNLNFKNF